MHLKIAKLSASGRKHWLTVVLHYSATILGSVLARKCLCFHGQCRQTASIRMSHLVKCPSATTLELSGSEHLCVSLIQWNVSARRLPNTPFCYRNHLPACAKPLRSSGVKSSRARCDAVTGLRTSSCRAAVRENSWLAE